MALSELWSMLEGKNYHPSAQQLFDDLKNGFDFQDEAVAPLLRADNPELRLPRFENNAALEWVGEIVIEENADIQALIDEYWEQAVAEHGEDYVCAPKDIVDVFQKVIAMRDPDGSSGVSAELIEGKTALSWESPEMAVHVGSKRAPIRNKEELFRKVLHEFGVHGQRAINGLKTKLPVLGTGLFTDTKRPDYLTYEEGLATTIEETIGDAVPVWTAAKFGHYINLSIAESGVDYRSVFETAWRYRLLSSLKPDQEVTTAMIDKAKSAAYTACNRIFRGTQPDLREKTGLDIKPLVFSKDAAYLSGRVLVMEHLKELHEAGDVAGVKRLFAGKFDPTNPVQADIMERALAG